MKPTTGDAASRHAHHDGDDDLEELHHDANNCHGNLGVLLLPEHGIQCAVFADHVVDGCHSRHKADLRQKAGHAKGQGAAADGAFQPKVCPRRANDLHVEQIPHCQRCRDQLTDDGSHRCAHHAPAEAENEDGVQNDVQHRTRKSGHHGKPGAAVRADDGVHSLPEHIERHAQRDIKEILLGVVVGLGVDRSAEHGKNGVRKHQIERGQHNAADQTQHHRIADAPLCLGDFVLPKADADEGAAAITDHHAIASATTVRGENDRIGGVAIRAEIAGVGNKDLVHDVVQRTHQQRK